MLSFRSTHDALTILFKTRGEAALDSPHTLSLEAKEELQIPESGITETLCVMWIFTPFKIILPTNLSPAGIIAPENEPLEWICLHQKG